MFKSRKISIASFMMLAMVLAASQAAAGPHRSYQVTITNITQGQIFTPILLATHKSSITLFNLGEPASMELEMLAEGGATAPLAGVLEDASRAVNDIQSGDALLGPGESVTFNIQGDSRREFLSLAAMLIPTNDTFVGLDSVRLPWWGETSYYARAYDAGTEENDQSCANIPGPRCGGEGYSPVPGPGDEGFIHVGNGFHELGDTDTDGFEVLGPATYDWRNPVAKVTIKIKRRGGRDDSDSDD